MTARLNQGSRDFVPAARSGPNRRKRTAFVFGGGGLAAPHAGTLRALYESGVRADFLVATSFGALNAAYVASRRQTVLTAVALGRVWTGMRREDVLPVDPMTLIGGVASHRDHLVPDRPLRRLASRHIQLERLEHAEVPLHLVCFDLYAGKEIRLSAGPALDAVLAAAAIPGVFAPVLWEGKLLVGGGVANPNPISHAIELGAERVYVLPGTSGVAAARPRGAIDATVRAFALLADGRLEADLVCYSQTAEVLVLPAGHAQATDFQDADGLIRGALASTRTALRQTPVAGPDHTSWVMTAHPRQSEDV